MTSGEGTAITVPALLDGVRVDRAVAMLAEVSRAQAAALVSAGRVRVDGQVVIARSQLLRSGSSLEIDPVGEGPVLEAEPDVAFGVVYEDDQLVVVDKPAGLVVHPGAGRRHGTLVSGLLARYPDLASVGDPARPGIVHRLDRGTSGLLVVARTEVVYRSLVAQLSARTASRRYLALAAGEVGEERGVVEAPVGRSNRTPTRMAVSRDGRPARTRYRTLRRYLEPLPSSLLAVALDTGRTHQIRVHLAAIGHPVVGDDRYGPGGRVGGSLLPGGRLFLHAAELTLDHPVTGERVGWRSPLPADLGSLLKDPPPLPDD
ncbi:MAG TPA: RluA family pseudouridine synthase [Acidimicrobiales bacterium]|nr:RluA family pseudouridine synthase [Acidimicrobiales bacterium]